MTPQITDQLKQQFIEEGYFVLESVVPENLLELLRSECKGFMDRVDAEMDAQNTDVIGINHRNKRYFAHDCYNQRPIMGEFLFSELMADICRATLGDEAYLFFNQYVVKCADKDSKFSWHQDSGYVHPYHKPYLTCWIPLDDVNQENGTVSILPYSRSGIRTWVQHVQDPVSNDLVGYFGSDKGIPVIVPAGSIAVFSSYVFHSSGGNLTQNMRRVFLAQYSGEVIKTADGEHIWAYSDHFVHNGERIKTS